MALLLRENDSSEELIVTRRETHGEARWSSQVDHLPWGGVTTTEAG